MNDLTTKESNVLTKSTTDCGSTKVRPENSSATTATTSSGITRPCTAELYQNLCDAVSAACQSSVKSLSASVCYVIMSTSSLLWTTLTLIATALIGVGLITPYWIITSPGRRTHFATAATVTANRSNHVGTVSIGVFNECHGLRKPEIADILGALTGGVTSSDVSGGCGTFVSGFDMPDEEFPDAWKSALLLLTGATVLMMFTDFSALASICIQSIFGKSIFTVSGLFQSIAGMCASLCNMTSLLVKAFNMLYLRDCGILCLLCQDSR